MTNLQPGQVNIRGKVYETVARRVHLFRERHPDWTMQTKIIESTENRVVMVAEILDETGRLRSNGHAEEFRKSSQINKTSATENCETSAIGRALAALGLGGQEFASANEVQNAIHQQEHEKPQRRQPLRQDEEIAKHLNACETLDELQDMWKGLTPEQRQAHELIKEACKNRMLSEQADKEQQLL